MLAPPAEFNDRGSSPGAQEGRGGLDASLEPEAGVDGLVSFGAFVAEISTWRAEPGTRAMHLLRTDAHHEIRARKGDGQTVGANKRMFLFT